MPIAAPIAAPIGAPPGERRQGLGTRGIDTRGLIPLAGEHLLGSQNVIHSTASTHEYDNVTWRTSASSPVAALFADRLREPRHPCAEDLPMCAGSAAALAAPSQQATRHARRVYVGGLPPTANEQNIATFMSNALAAVGGTTAGPGACHKASARVRQHACFLFPQPACRAPSVCLQETFDCDHRAPH